MIILIVLIIIIIGGLRGHKSRVNVLYELVYTFLTRTSHIMETCRLPPSHSDALHTHTSPKKYERKQSTIYNIVTVADLSLTSYIYIYTCK